MLSQKCPCGARAGKRPACHIMRCHGMPPTTSTPAARGLCPCWALRCGVPRCWVSGDCSPQPPDFGALGAWLHGEAVPRFPHGTGHLPSPALWEDVFRVLGLGAGAQSPLAGVIPVLHVNWGRAGGPGGPRGLLASAGSSQKQPPSRGEEGTLAPLVLSPPATALKVEGGHLPCPILTLFPKRSPNPVIFSRNLCHRTAMLLPPVLCCLSLPPAPTFGVFFGGGFFFLLQNSVLHGE